MDGLQVDQYSLLFALTVEGYMLAVVPVRKKTPQSDKIVKGISGLRKRNAAKVPMLQKVLMNFMKLICV